MLRLGLGLNKIYGVQAVAGMGGGAAPTYLDKVLAIQSAALVGYWPLNETSGTAILDAGGTYNGAYSNVTLNNATGPDGVNGAPLFNGLSSGGSKGDLYSTALRDAINYAEGTLSLWYKVASAGVLSDGAVRVASWLGTADDANEIYHWKSSVANRVDAYRRGSGTPDGVNDESATSTAWVHKVITWSITDNLVKVYKNGSLLGQSGTLGAWGAVPARILIGCKNTNVLVWSGWLAHVGIWATPLSLAEVQSIANPNP